VIKKSRKGLKLSFRLPVIIIIIIIIILLIPLTVSLILFQFLSVPDGNLAS